MNGNILLPGIQGRPGCTVIERADNARRLMYLDTWYLEGFCESEAPANKLGDNLLFWYAKAVVTTLAASGCLSKESKDEGSNEGNYEDKNEGNNEGKNENKNENKNEGIVEGKESTLHNHNKKNSIQRQKKILILGLGAGVLPAFIQKYFPHIHIDVCEINQSVVDASIHGFGLKENSIHIFVEDCLNMVKRLTHSNQEYDGVICDVYGDGGMPRVLCDIYFLQHLKKLVAKRNGIVLLNCGFEMDHYSVVVNNFNWIFGIKNSKQFGHPDEENRVLVGDLASTSALHVSPSDPEWKEKVEQVIRPDLFTLFLIQKMDEDKAMYYMTFLDQFGICANDSLSVNATKIQFANRK